MIGRTISHYRIEAQLGAGGMGVVYRAEDIRLGRGVALKFLSDDLAHDEDAVRRLRAEARAASALNHGNICTIYDIDEVDGHPFIAMELLKGRSLRECLVNGPLKVRQLVDIGIEIADALQAAHAEGIVHRDITPGNIFITDRGHVKMLDFGLAKVTALSADPATTADTTHRTAKGITLGTVAYMSPEQATGEQLDGRTDLFSLGVVLYECATGRHPFPGKTSAVIFAAILNRAPVAPVALNPELPLRLQDVINNCLEKDRELRYQSAGDLRADLKRVRRDLESGASRAIAVADAASGNLSRDMTPPIGSAAAVRDRTHSTATPRRRGVTMSIVAAALAVSLTAFGGYAVWHRHAPEQGDSNRTAADTTVQDRLALATASLDARNYRAALAYASDVLAIDPNQPAATRIRDNAKSTLARFDAAIADARRQATAGDLRGAAAALETARAIDPDSPTIVDLASGLAGQSRDSGVVGLTGLRRSPGERPPAPDARTPAAGSSRSAAPQPKEVPAPSLPPPAAPASPPVAVSSAPPASPPAASTPSLQPHVAPPPSLEATGVPRAPAPPPAPERREREPRTAPPPPPPAEDDEEAIRRVIANYGRAIETKDLALFRSIKPNLSREEERRLQDGFRAVASQRVDLTVVSIDRRGDNASVALKRRDTIETAGRAQTIDSEQTLQLTRASAGWVVAAIR